MARQSVARSVTLNNATAALVVGPSPKRVAVLFVPGNAGRYTIGTENTVTLDSGPTLQTGGPTIEITLEKHGEIVQRAWYGFGAAAGATYAGVIETFDE